MPLGAKIVPLIVYGLIFIIGLLNAIVPRLLWKTFESWKAKKEPSKTFFVVRRVVGIIVVLIIAALFLVPYLMGAQCL